MANKIESVSPPFPFRGFLIILNHPTWLFRGFSEKETTHPPFSVFGVNHVGNRVVWQKRNPGLISWRYCDGLSDVEIRHQAESGRGLERWLCWPLWCCPVLSADGVCLALGGVPLGSCVLFILEIKLGSGESWVDGVAGLLVFLTCAVLPLILSCLWF